VKVHHGGKNNYVIFAENRPLIALHQMVTQGLLITEELQEHLNLYKGKLVQLLNNNRLCRDKYEIVSYRDTDTVSNVLKKKIEDMREDYEVI